MKIRKESEDRILTKRCNETNYKTPSSGRTGSQDFQQPLHRRLPENDINIIPFPIILPFWVLYNTRRSKSRKFPVRRLIIQKWYVTPVSVQADGAWL